MENVAKLLIFQEPMLSENPRFYVIDNNIHQNPWRASSYKLTPRDIYSLTNLGIRIVATPHIGLHWPSNSMYPRMGVKISDYTANQSIRDYADEPENIIEGGKRYFCAKEYEPTLSPYLHLNKNSLIKTKTRTAEKFYDKKSLAHIHHLSKKIVLGEDNMCLDADILKDDFVFDTLNLLVRNEKYILNGYADGIFNRFVSKNGILERCNPASASCIPDFINLKQKQADMIRNDYIEKVSGHIPIKEVIVMIDALACYRSQIINNVIPNSNTFIGNTFSVSGIDMVNYLKGNTIRGVLQRMYEVLYREFTWLPVHMRYFIIPGGILRFMPSSAEPRLEEAIIRSLNLNNEIFIANKKVIEANDRKDLSDAIEVKSLLKKRFYESQKEYIDSYVNRRGFSQYDLLLGEKISDEIVNAIFDLSLDDIVRIFPIKNVKKT